MGKNNLNAGAFLLLAPDAGCRAHWKEQLERYGTVRACRSVDTARKEIEKKRHWYALVVDMDADGRATHRLLTSMRRSHPTTPVLVLSDGPPRSTKTLDELGVRSLERDSPPAEVRYFLGHALTLAHTGSPLVAEAVESLGRRHSLTVKQMQLTALATTDVSREDLIAGLGVSHNTVKTRVRQLLRIHREETMDTLGKKVLRAAVLHAAHPAWPSPIILPTMNNGPAPRRKAKSKRKAAARA